MSKALIEILLDQSNLKSTLIEDFDKSLFKGISWSYSNFHDHYQVIKNFQNKNPYTITILIENLKYKHCNRKEYVKKTKIPIVSKYRELLYDMFFKEYGQEGGNRLYGQWLDKYYPIWQKEEKYKEVDDYIIKQKLEPRYQQKILKIFRNHDKLFKARFKIKRDLYYNLTPPLNYIDWRNPFDNIFIWRENGRKIARRGGGGSSGSRETNSIFIFGFLELNKIKPITSYLFLYSDENKLLFIKKFNRLCVPIYDIGSNYYLDSAEIERIKKGGLFLRWDDFGKIKKIVVERK